MSSELKEKGYYEYHIHDFRNKGYAGLHYIYFESFQFNEGTQEYESLHLDDSMGLCGQRDAEDDGRNACQFLCLTQQLVECQTICVGELILQEKQVGLDVFDEVQRCRSAGYPFRIMMRLE